MPIDVPCYIYVQQNADYSLPYPGEGFTGWTNLNIPLDPSKTAIVIMHAWDILPYEQCPGIHRMCEYVLRSQKIMEERFPSFLEAVRNSSIRLIHVGSSTEKTLATHPKYQEILKKYPEVPHPRMQISEQTQRLRDLHQRIGSCSEENEQDFLMSCEHRDFAIKPLDTEDLVCTSEQLYAVCLEHGIEHLIYTGFALNWCLTYNECGMVDMNRYGLMCSVVGDLTTAVENKESCRNQDHLKYGLWQFATYNGFVFLADDLKHTLLQVVP